MSEADPDHYARMVREGLGRLDDMERPPNTAPPHPDRTAARVHLRIGNSVSFEASARTVPAILVATGVLVSAILLSIVPLVRTGRRPARGQW